MKILVTGGAGLLGRELKKIAPELIQPSRVELDITSYTSVAQTLDTHKPNVLLHLAAFTKPPQHEERRSIGIETNIIGTANVARACDERGIRLVYASTDYVYVGSGPHKESEAVSSPYRFGWSKLGGECAVQMTRNFLILRLSFGPVPFPWDKVYRDQWNSKLYVDEIAPLVLKAAQSDYIGVLNIGGPKNTLEAYARRTKPDISTVERPDWVPSDTSLDLTLMKEVLGISDERSLLKR